MMPALQAALLFVFPVLVVIAALYDVTSYTIPNWISGLLILGFFPAAFALGLPLGAIGFHFGLGVAFLLVGMAMFALGWIGGGDAKLFAAAGLWLGWPAAATYLVIIGVAGGGLAMLLLTLRSSWIRPFVTLGPGWFGRLTTPGESVPYGVAIAAGALAAFAGSSLWRAWGGF